MDKSHGSVYVAEIKRKYKDKTYTTFLLRRSYRENGKVKQQTLGNLTALPPEAITLLRGVLHGQRYLPEHEGIEIVSSRAHGHVAAVRAMAQRLDLDRLLDPAPSPERDLVMAMIVARVVEPHTKLATTRWWQTTSLVTDPVVAQAAEDHLYGALDWLVARQDRIELGLARRHLAEGGLVLYDLTSSYVEGTHCPLAARGYNRDGKQGRLQVNYGLIVDAQGRPVAVEVYRGNTSDPKTVQTQVDKLKRRFGLGHVVLAGDRGMLTSARIAELRATEGIDWISALRAKEIQSLTSAGTISPSLFDQRDLAEVTSPDFPGERLIVCRNPLLAEERARTREALLAATEQLLDKLAKRVTSGRLKQAQKISEALGRIKNRFKMSKHFDCTVAEGQFSYQRKSDGIQREAATDGLYVVRTSVKADSLSTEQAVLSYKQLSKAERAFRTLKSVDLRVRPIHHWTAERVRAHILLCMLAYYVEWHLREAWR